MRIVFVSPAAREIAVDNIAVPWWISVGASVVIAAISLVVGLLTYPDIAPAMPLFALAIVWMLVTSRSRRTYRDSRLRSRAAANEREYRQSKS
jgi:hypothetical protein